MSAQRKTQEEYRRQRHNGVRKGKPIKFDRLLKSIVDDFLKQDPSTRIRLLASDLGKNADSKRAKKLQNSLYKIAEAFDSIDHDWNTSGLIDSVRYFVDSHIEMMLPHVLTVMLHQLNVEAILTDTHCLIRYQEHMRLAAGLPKQLSQPTENFITDIYNILISSDRKKRNKITPGGKVSPLKQYAHALCFHYERLHPIWRTVKSI